MSETTKINRRRFLKITGGAIGFATLSCVGAGLVGIHQPKVDMVTASCANAGGARLLVTYASRAGATAEIAKAIGETLCEVGYTADVMPVTEVRDVTAYQGIVIGSAIYMGRWMAPATAFLDDHLPALQTLPVAMFTVCLTLKDRTAENLATVAGYLDPVLEQTGLQPADVGLFAGRLAPENLSPLYRAIAKQMGSGEGDYRDWSAIAAWALNLPAKLGIA